MARKLGTFKGTEAGLPQKFADDPVMVSRVGSFSSFTDDNDTSNLQEYKTCSDYHNLDFNVFELF